MKVLFVCNNAFTKGNGLCTSVQTTLKNLRAEGIDARLMAAENRDPNGPQPDFPLKHFKFPLFESIIYANGFCYATHERKKMEEAIRWADVIHFEEALSLEVTAMKIARSMGKPCVGTYHLFPENILANLGMGKFKFISWIIQKLWNRNVFNHLLGIQCPTVLTKEVLEKSGCKARLQVMTNGIEVPQERVIVTPPATDPINILCIGRLSNEKAPQVLLKAMQYSKYAHKIQLQFAGKGPKAKKYQRLADSLFSAGIIKYRPQFGFYEKSQLPELSRNAYLYIHNAWCEVEGLSCLEALAMGAVPVIACAPLSATSQFALCPESMYPVMDSRALAQRIDWWIEHPEFRAKMSQRYADSAREYDIKDTTRALISMYDQALLMQ